MGEKQAAGKRPSFDALPALYHKRIYNLIYRLLGNAEDTADIPRRRSSRRTGLMGASMDRRRLSSPGCVPSRRITAETAFGGMGRRQRHEAGSLDGQMWGDESTTMEVASTDSECDPLSALERRELDEKIQEAIMALPPEFRLVVVLRDMHGLSYKEIAEAAGLSVDNVKARLYRARAGLRRRLGVYVDERT